MANVLQPHIDFHPRPVAHAPSPFGFGFGLNAPPSTSLFSATWHPSHSNSSAFQQMHPRPQKRRLEVDEDQDPENIKPVLQRDHSMDRSPTPERPKKAPPKRARVVTSAESARDDSQAKDEKTVYGTEDNVDVGVLLASLPPQSLLHLLTSLLNTQPTLKSTILPLIPRPSLDIATGAVAQSAKKLRDAYPYSTASSFSQPSFSASFDFAKPSSSMSDSHHSGGNGGMRDSYIISRLRPHVSEFVSMCNSYLPYFSAQDSSSSPSQSLGTPRIVPTDKSRLTETFIFLSAITNHMMSQPPLAQTVLGEAIFPRLSQEWDAWVRKVDDIVNVQGGMFGSETVRSWERGLDEFAEAKSFQGADMMRAIRDQWVLKVGWLIGRIVHPQMDEL